MARPARRRLAAGGWLEGDQQRAWLAYIRVQLRLAYEMNRQLLADSDLSLPDYDVLTALSVAGGGRMPITALAAHIGWERSRVSHHVRRMSARGLVTCGLSAADRRVTEVGLTGRGRQALEQAAPGHVDLVRRLFFEGLPDGLVRPLGEANHRDPVMISHMNDRKPRSVTADIRSLEMTKAQPRPGEATGACTAGSGHATRLAAGDPRPQRRHGPPGGPAHPACRTGARAARSQGCRIHDMSCKVGGAFHDLRKIAENAKNDLRERLSPEFAGFEIEDVNPEQFVHKHVFGDLKADQEAQQQPARQAAPNGTLLPPGDRPRPTRTDRF